MDFYRSVPHLQFKNSIPNHLPGFTMASVYCTVLNTLLFATVSNYEHFDTGNGTQIQHGTNQVLPLVVKWVCYAVKLSIWSTKMSHTHWRTCGNYWPYSTNVKFQTFYRLLAKINFFFWLRWTFLLVERWPDVDWKDLTDIGLPDFLKMKHRSIRIVICDKFIIFFLVQLFFIEVSVNWLTCSHWFYKMLIAGLWFTSHG